ncbi:MAG: pentapeptide repeat-containing protein [Candidatus Gastranaerophilales bacterium]|nr:pentapeptide repeat-containing protein [Candidatus Gastranaerophilales bacterium]
MTENIIELLKQGKFDEFNAEIKNNVEDLTESDLSGMELSGVSFYGHDLSGSDFSETTLDNVNFEGTDLSSATFARAHLTTVAFNGAVLNGTKFNNAQIYSCDFTDADMSGADFSESDLSDSDLSLSLNLNKCTFDKFTIWPDADNLPSDFDTDYQDDLASLNEDDDYNNNEDY